MEIFITQLPHTNLIYYVDFKDSIVPRGMLHDALFIFVWYLDGSFSHSNLKSDIFDHDVQADMWSACASNTQRNRT